MAARLRELYQKQVIDSLRKEHGYKNLYQVPRLEKILLNMGLGEAIQNAKILDSAVVEIAAITGQKPVITKAKKAIANFKLRKGLAIGAMVTLRGERMYEFLDRLVNVALPKHSTGGETTRSAFASRSSFPRSTSTRSTR